MKAPQNRSFGDGLGVGVGQDDAGVVAAELQGEALDGVRGGADDGLAGGGGAGEHDLADVGVGGEGVADVAAAGDHGEEPSGRASLMVSTRASTRSGVYSEGLTTTALPIRRAGAICQTVIIMGQFQGPMAPTTPMGR